MSDQRDSSGSRSQEPPGPVRGGRRVDSQPSFTPDEVNTIVSVPPPALLTNRAFVGGGVRDRATFTVLTGPNTGAMYSVESDAIMGRGRDCAIRIDEPVVSRQHARVTRDSAGAYLLQDMGSRNGTFVNGIRVESHQLAEGDRVTFGSALTLRFGMTDEVEELLLRRLYESSVLDALTGAFNRKHFSERLLGEVAYAKRHQTPLTLLLFDIDHFKLINDTYGHLVGDFVLKKLAEVVMRSLRTEDVFARYGGEEFVVIARGTDLARGHLFGERLRVIVEQTSFECEGHTLKITISIGVASLACCHGAAVVEELVGIADRRMYEAKTGGRNRTVAG